MIGFYRRLDILRERLKKYSDFSYVNVSFLNELGKLL